jgi:hypothetical protein
MFTGVEAAMEHFDRIEMLSFGRADDIIRHYKERSKKFKLCGTEKASVP